MGVITKEVEVACTIPAAKFFKASFVDADNLLPKLVPQIIKSIEVVEGNGGAGTVKIVTLGEAVEFQSMKHRIDELDEANLSYGYTIIGGDILMDVLESITNQFKVVPTEDGCLVKHTTIFTTKGDAVLGEEHVKKALESTQAMFLAVDAYLKANPDAY